MMRHSLLIIIVIFIATGCQSSRHDEVVNQPVVRPPRLAVGDMRRVRTSPYVETYHVGRTIDRNGNMMHEAHRVYRLASREKWDQRPLAQPLYSRGPVTGLADPLAVPPPRNALINAELNRQRHLSKDMAGALRTTKKQAEQLKEKAEAYAQSSINTADIQKKLKTTQEELVAAKQDLAVAKDKQALLEAKLKKAKQEAAEAGADIKESEFKGWNDVDF